MDNVSHYPNGLAFILKYYGHCLYDTSFNGESFWMQFLQLLDIGEHVKWNQEERKSMKYLLVNFVSWCKKREFTRIIPGRIDQIEELLRITQNAIDY